MRKLFCVCLCFVFLLSGALVGCDEKDAPDSNIDPVSNTNDAKSPSDTEPQTAPLQTPDPKEISYTTALNLLEDGKIQEAYDIFLSLKDFKDVSVYLDRFSFHYTTETVRSSESASTTYFEYDEYGKKTYYLYFSSCSSAIYSYTYTYDENENLLKRVFLFLSPPYESIEAYEYDAQGNPIRYTESDGSVTTLEYDENGNLIKEISPNKSTYEYGYDHLGNLSKTIFKKNDGTIEWETINEYDTNGHLIKETTTESNGYTEEIVYEYDENENLIKKTCREHQNSKEYWDSYSWSYDDHGNMTEYHHEYNGKWTEANYYEYNSANLCIKQTYVSGKNINVEIAYQSVTTYEYDSYGNLVKEIKGGETDSTDDDSITVYSGYRLFYNPKEPQIFPENILGKG